MKKTVFLLLLAAQTILAQEHPCAKHKQTSHAREMTLMSKAAAAANPQISHEVKYDVKFVHLNLNVERNTKYISGNVRTVGTVTIAPMDTFMTLLHLNLTIDSIRFNNVLVNAIRQDSIVKFKTPSTLNSGNSFTAVVYYKGTPPTGGSALGSGFSNATSPSWGNQATWSLSESFVGYHWWPCKQMLTDKIDSSWVFITTDSLNKAGSNGLLKNVVTVGNKKRFEWKSRYPIAYYLISVAVARYKEYTVYAKPQYLPNDSIMIQNYVYDAAINNNNWINSQKVVIDNTKQVMNFLCNMYGMYPFYKEKYGNCMAPLGGGMEHQTMTTIGFFEYYINAHELGHHWWGDNVTCKTWGDIWINEGFASYTEHLTAQYLDPSNFAGNLSSVHNNVMSQPGGSVFFTNSDTLNSSRIFNSRLTYDKGGAIVHTLRFVTNNDSLWFNTLRGFQNLYKDKTASTVDFMNYYQAQTNINPTQFFSQWYYGEGYPTFNVKWNYNGSKCFIQSTQSVSMPNVTPLFITPIQYRISRAGKPDTTVRVMHGNTTETYTIPLTGTVMSVMCDPNNWLINKTVGPSRDVSLGAEPNLSGIDDINGGFDKISVGPNPVKGFVQILNPDSKEGEVWVYDVQGKKAMTMKLERDLSLDLGGFSDGLYILKIIDLNGNERLTQKLVKQ